MFYLRASMLSEVKCVSVCPLLVVFKYDHSFTEMRLQGSYICSRFASFQTRYGEPQRTFDFL